MTGTNLFAAKSSTVDVALTNAAGDAVLVKCAAASLPTDSGYAVGCIAFATDTGILYTNQGTTSVASFTSVPGGAALTLPSALTDAVTTTGASLSVTDSAITTGEIITAANGNTTNFTTGAALFYGDMSSATAGNGLVIVGTGAYTGTGLAHLSTGAMTTGVGLQITSTSGLTSGSLLRATTSTAGAVATNGVISIRATGAYTSTSNAGLLDVQASALVGAGTVVNIKATAASQTASNLLNVVQSGATITAYTTSISNFTGGFAGASSTGSVMLVTAVNDEAGDGVKIVNNALTLGAATILNLSHTTSVLGAGTSMLRITSTSVDTGTTTGTLLDLASTATTGHIALITASAGTTGGALNINVSGAAQTTASAIRVIQTVTTTGFTGSLVSILGSSTTGSGNALGVTGVNTTAGDTVKFINNAVVAGTSTILNVSHTTSVLGAGNSMVRITSTSADTGSTTGTLLDLAQTGVAAGNTAVMLTDASSSTAARIGILAKVTNSAAVLAVPLKLQSVAVTGTGAKWVRMQNFSDGTLVNTIFKCIDNTDADAVLTGVKGDLILNGPGGAPQYCDADGANWTTLT